MRIISWNCSGGLRKKLEQLNELSADLLIIQECEDPALSTEAFKEWAGNYLWLGKSKNKGIGIFPKNGHSIKALDWNGSFTLKGIKSNSKALTWTSDELESFLPFMLNDSQVFVAVWTKKGTTKSFGYMGQFWKYLQIFKKEIEASGAIICGDFNSNRR